MVQPVQASSLAPTIPVQSVTVNPLYQNQFGISTLTQGLTSRKSLIVLSFLAAWATLIIFLTFLLKKAYSTRPEAWVEKNCNDLDGPHQEVLARLIGHVKNKLDSSVNPSVRAVVDMCSVGNCSCAVCKNIKIYILQYFIANEPKPNEIDAWVEQNCHHLIENHQFRVASVIELASKEMQSMVKPDGKEVVYTFFDTLFGKYIRVDDWKIIDCVLRYFRDKNQEIQVWLLRQYKGISEEVLAQVVQRVHEIEKLPAYLEDPKLLICELRLESFTKPDPIQSKALSYLTQSRAQAYLKDRYGKKEHNFNKNIHKLWPFHSG